MDLTPAQYDLISRGKRHRGYRLKAKKPDGIHIPGITTEFPASETFIDGTGDYPAPNTTGENYIALIRDTYKNRNRTFVLHYNQFSENYNAVISVIDHKTNIIYILNKTTISGTWPETTNVYPDNWLYDEKTNFLYVSVPAIAAVNPRILRIDMSMELGDGDTLDSCSTVAQKPPAQLWTCYLFEALSGLTRKSDGLGPAAYPSDPRCHYKIIAHHNNKLYCWYQNNYTGGDFIASNFGYFDSAGTYFTLWAWGVKEDGLGTQDARVVLWPGGNSATTTLGPLSASALLTFCRVESYYYNPETHNVTLAFTPGYPTTLPSYGAEAFVIEFNLDLLIDHTNRNFSTEMIAASNTFWFRTPGDPGPTWYYYPAGTSGAMTSAIDQKIDCQFASWPDNQQLVEIYIEWEYIAYASFPYWLRIETAIEAASGQGGAEQMNTLTGSWAGVVMIDPADPFIRVVAYYYVGNNYPAGGPIVNTLPTELRLLAWVRPFPFSTVATASVMNTVPLMPIGDVPPETEDLDPGSAPAYADETNQLTHGRLQIQKVVDPSPYTNTVPVAIIESGDFFYIGIDSGAAVGLGLWQVNKNGLGIKRIIAATSDLADDNIDWISPVDDSGHSNSFLVASSPYSLTLTRNKVQYFNVVTGQIEWNGDGYDSGVVGLFGHIFAVAYGADWTAYCTYKVIHIFKPAYSTSTQERWLRNWWDGTNPDIIIEGDDPLQLDETGRTAGITGLSFTNSKGEASYDLNFAVGDVNYMPWVDSVFNENPAAPGTYSGVLEDGTRLIMQRGVLGDNGEWIWIDECQVFIISEPARAQAGIARMTLDCKGVIGMFITRSIYEWIHRPDEQIYTAVTFITTDNLIY